MMTKISAVLPSWGRKNLTLRMLQCVASQTLQEYELFFLGDKCPVFEEIIKTEDFQEIKKTIADRMIFFNFDNHDGTSAQAINYAMKHASGEFFVFLSNDDLIFNNHFETYYQKSTKELNSFTTCIDYGNGQLVKRIPKFEPRSIGHSEICAHKSLIAKMPPHTRNYGHDWEFIQHCLKNMCSTSTHHNEPTYIVNLSGTREHNWEGGRLL